MNMCIKLENNLNTLNVLFEARDEEIATITKKDKKELANVNGKLRQKENEFKESIECKERTKEILNLFYEYSELLNERGSYYEKNITKRGSKMQYS